MAVARGTNERIGCTAIGSMWAAMHAVDTCLSRLFAIRSLPGGWKMSRPEAVWLYPKTDTRYTRYTEESSRAGERR